MLLNTLGCPLTFNHRKLELETAGQPCSDEDIVESFVDSVSRDGVITQFLRLGQLGLVMHDTLFIHGCIKDDVAGCFDDTCIHRLLS